MPLGRLVLYTALALASCGGATPVSRDIKEEARPSAPPPTVDEPHPWPPSPTVVTFPSGNLSLHGFLYRPSGSGPFPAVVANHGSERAPGTELDQALFHVRHGFGLFVPHRRGHGLSSDAGPYVVDTYEKSGGSMPILVRELEAQSDDVMAARRWIF